MPRIWFKDKRGAAFHIDVDTASWTGDYNTPETAETIPQTIVTADRCMNTVTFTTPKGTFSIILDVNGRTGSCNQCGQCCSHLITDCQEPTSCGYVVDGSYHRCQYLTVHGPGIGKKNGTSCSIHSSLLYESLKGCVCYPASPNEITSLMTACGFRFP